jgi:hypothetical protein
MVTVVRWCVGWPFYTCFLPGRIEVMPETTYVYWTFCSYYYSSAGKVGGHHRVVKAGETGIAGCMWLGLGYADCKT